MEKQYFVTKCDENEQLTQFLETQLHVYNNEIESNEKKRTAISIEKTIEIINDHEKNIAPKELSLKYGYKASTICTILSNKDKIKAIYESSFVRPDQKRLKTTTYPEIDDAVELWYNNIKSNNINGPEIKVQAMKYATMLQNLEFKASNGWLDNFKKRHGLSFKTSCGEAGLVDMDVVRRWKDNVLTNLLKDLALFYRALPEQTMHYKNMLCNNVKVSKDILRLY